MAEYSEIKKTEDRFGGVPIILKLQQRLDTREGPHYVFSWRTRYRGGANRRFYYAPKEGGCWTVPMGFARDLLEHAEFLGMLDTRYDFGDTYPLLAIYSSSDPGLDAVQKRSILNDIVGFPEEPEWGDEPLFVVGEFKIRDDVKGRKILLANPSKDLCTFRSTTTDPEYKPIVRFPHDTIWRLDNSMQDADTRIVREFLKFLKGIG